MRNIDESLHPEKLGNVRLKFKFWSRPVQYLEHFKVITKQPYMFMPLNLEFETYDELLDFLTKRGVVGYEQEINVSNGEKQGEEIHFVDVGRIYDDEIDLNNRILQYKLYSVNEIAGMLSMSRPTVYKLIDSGELKAKRINGQLRIIHSDYVSFINKNI